MMKLSCCLRTYLVWGLSLVIWGYAPLLSAQNKLPVLPSTQQSKPEASKPSALSIAERLAAAQAALQQVIAAEQSQTLPRGVSASDALFKRVLLERLVAAYARQTALSREKQQLQQQQKQAEVELETWQGFKQVPPYPIAMVETLRSHLQTGRWEQETQTALQSLLQQMREEALASLKSQEVQLRQAQEQQEGVRAPEERALLLWRLDSTSWRREVAASEVIMLESLLEVVQLKQTTLQAKMALWQKQLDKIGKQIRFDTQDLQALQAKLTQEKQKLEQQLSRAEQQRQQVQTQFNQLEQSIKSWQDRKDVPQAEATLQALNQRLAVQAQARDNADLAVNLVRIRLGTNAQESGIWRYRQQLYAGKADNLVEVSKASQLATKELSGMQDYLQKEVTLTMARMNDVQRNARSDTQQAGVFAELAQLYRQRLEMLNATQEPVLASLSSLGVLQSEFDLAVTNDDTPEGVALQFGDHISSALRGVWQYELFSADDSVEINGQTVTATRSVTVGKSIGAVLVLLLGYGLSMAILGWLKRRIIRWFGISEASATVWWRWSYMLVISLLVIFALNLVKIPLTLFAFLGGALAIGVGFGTQNILKNLISGIMLLIERPLKLGDYIQVGNISGTVVNIGLRSSVVRAGDGIETLIPNSTFIESAVTNWTYSSHKIRSVIALHVAYGSPSDKVSHLVLSEVKRHGLVLKDPAPRVLFSHFGDEALEFELEYWLDMAQADRRVVASDLRHMIDKALSEQGIKI